MPVLPFERLTDAQLEAVLKLQHPFLTAVESDPDSWFKVPEGVDVREPWNLPPDLGSGWFPVHPVSFQISAPGWDGSLDVERRRGAGEVWVKLKEVEG